MEWGMRGKLLLIAGLATGYVLGSKAGRKRYDQIAKVTGKFWNSRPVQKRVHEVEDFAKDVAPEVAGFLGGAAKKITGSSTAESSSTRRRSGSRRTTTPPAGSASPSE